MKRNSAIAVPHKHHLWVRLICVALIIPPLVLAVGPPHSYELDLAMAGFWWVWSVAAFVLLALLVYTRSRVALGSLLIVACCSWPVAASRTLLVPREPSDRAHGDVSVVLFNSFMNNTTVGEVGPFAYGLDADVLVVIEPVWEFYRSVRILNQIHETYPNILERSTEENAPHFLVFSKWKMSYLKDEPLENRDGIVCVLHRPEALGGPFLVVVAHPQSPRTPDRWHRGNYSVQRIAARIGTLVDSGYPVLFATDLNSTPGGKRDRILRTISGTRRSKPLLGAWGTYPSSWPVGRIAIDDIWHSEGIEVKSWKTIVGPGSDHRAIFAVMNIVGGVENP